MHTHGISKYLWPDKLVCANTPDVLVMWALGIEFRFQGLQGKHSPNWTISPLTRCDRSHKEPPCCQESHSLAGSVPTLCTTGKRILSFLWNKASSLLESLSLGILSGGCNAAWEGLWRALTGLEAHQSRPLWDTVSSQLETFIPKGWDYLQIHRTKTVAPSVLEQSFSTLLVLWPFNTAPFVVVTPQP